MVGDRPTFHTRVHQVNTNQRLFHDLFSRPFQVPDKHTNRRMIWSNLH
jgi:hypothetical protein